MLLLYRLGIHFYALCIWIASTFNEKARKFREGRKEQRNNIHVANSTRPIWIHAASLGEFEQGRPIIEQLKKKQPNIKIVLTFFSPSGYEARKNYPLADCVYYLPLDTPKNAASFITKVNPRLAIFIKYEFWYYFLKELQHQRIPTLMVSSIFRPNQLYFHWSGRFFRDVFRKVDHFFVQDQPSKTLIETTCKQVTIAGDTRFDRVWAVAKNEERLEKIEQFVNEQDTFIFGSTWPSDMNIIGAFIKKHQSSFKFIIAPHQIKAHDLAVLEKSFQHVTKYSSHVLPADAQIMIVDKIGLLSSLYRYAKYAYIGGGFRGALHNTLEAAVYGIPVFFGKHANNAKFIEAVELVQRGGAFELSNKDELEMRFQQLESDAASYEYAAIQSKSFIGAQRGATEKVMKKIEELL